MENTIPADDPIMSYKETVRGNPHLPIDASEEDARSHIQKLRDHFMSGTPTYTPEQEADIKVKHDKVLCDILYTLDSNDNPEMQSLRKYIQSRRLVGRSPEERLKFIDTIIEWANDPVSYDTLYNEKKERLKSLKYEMKSIRHYLKEMKQHEQSSNS